MNTYEKLKEIIVDKLNVTPEAVTPEARLEEDLGADSLAVMELISVIEDQFKIEISDEDAEKIKTVGDAVKYIEEKSK